MSKPRPMQGSRHQRSAALLHVPARHRVRSTAVAQAATVSFKVVREVKYGQALYVAGPGAALGQWKVDGSLELHWTDGHVWTADCQMPAGEAHEYKYLIRSKGGGVDWCPGDNRHFALPADAEVAQVLDAWTAGQSRLEVLQRASPTPPLAPPPPPLNAPPPAPTAWVSPAPAATFYAAAVAPSATAAAVYAATAAAPAAPGGGVSTDAASTPRPAVLPAVPPAVPPPAPESAFPVPPLPTADAPAAQLEHSAPAHAGRNGASREGSSGPPSVGSVSAPASSTAAEHEASTADTAVPAAVPAHAASTSAAQLAKQPHTGRRHQTAATPRARHAQSTLANSPASLKAGGGAARPWPPAPDSTATVAQLRGLSKTQIQDVLVLHGLKKSGVREELIARLVTAGLACEE